MRFLKPLPNKNSYTTLSYQVFDMSGREVAVQKQQNTEGGIVQVQAASWAKGLYIVKITTDKGETQQHKLFKK